MNRNLCRLLFGILMGCVVILPACKESGGQGISQGARAEDPAEVKWENLRHLDETIHELDAKLKANSLADAREMIPHLLEHAAEVASETPPSNAKDAVRTELHQRELETLNEALKDYESMGDAEVKGLLESYPPLVETLMATAGLPHKHDHDHDHDHGDDHSHDEHDDHDHAHDDDHTEVH